MRSVLLSQTRLYVTSTCDMQEENGEGQKPWPGWLDVSAVGE